MQTRRLSPFIYLGVFFVSAAALGLEILLTRILAVMMWHHFTYVVIGVALLGFGAAGSFVMVRDSNGPSEEAPERRLARYSAYFAMSAPVCYAMMIRVAFAPLSLQSDPSNLVGLLLIYLLIAVPFFFAGLAICDAIQSYSEHVGSVYFVDLVGAGLGAAAAVLLIERLTAPGAMIAFSAVAAVGGTCFAIAGLRTAPISMFVRVVFGGVLTWVLATFGVDYAREGNIDPPLAPSKEMRTFNLGEPEMTAWNPLARIDVTKPASVPPAMGGSFPKKRPKCRIRGIFQDGAAPTLFLEWNSVLGGKFDFLKEASAAAGHIALKARGVEGVEEMAIGVGGGIDLLIGLHFGVKSVTGVEINAATVRLLEEDYAEFTGGLAAHKDVEMVNAEGRHFANSSDRKFDLIQLSGVDTYTALSSGAYTLSESYLYTDEAVRVFLNTLTPDGVVCYSRFIFKNQPRESLRLAATAVEALASEGAERPQDHLFIVGGAAWASLVISKKPLEPAVLESLRAFADRNEYTVFYDPSTPTKNFFDDLLRRDAAGRQEFYELYPFNVRPATDDKPFFFNYFKWKNLRQTNSYGGHAYTTSYPIGHLCLVISLLQTFLLGAFFILRPLRKLGKLDGGGGVGTAATFLYFSALGVGFISLEIVLIQRFVLFLGHPTYSLTTVLPTMLIAAGIGSSSIRPGTDPVARLKRLLFLIPAAVVFGWLLSTYALDSLIGLPLGVRVLLAIAVLSPIGFVLGMAFPCGVRIVTAHRPKLVPWVWAVNSFTTVLGSTAAVLLAMEVGFSVVALAVAPLYIIGILALLFAFGNKIPPLVVEPD